MIAHPPSPAHQQAPAIVPGEQAFALSDADPARTRPDLGLPGLHLHPDMVQVILATSGQAACELDGLRLTTTAPCLITVPGGAVHGFHVQGRTAGWAATIAHHKVLDLMVNRSLDIGLLLRKPHVVAPGKGSGALANLSRTLEMLCAEGTHEATGSRVCVEALQHLVLVHAARLVLDGHDLIARPSNGQRDLFLAYRDLVERNFERERRVSWYVARLRTSSARLNAVCRRFAASTAKDVILNRLVEEARRRLVFTRLSATRIGYDLGFAEPAYFLRFFRQRTGLTPAGWRAEAARGSGEC
jgi:AraC-like DNA-binding protein